MDLYVFFVNILSNNEQLSILKLLSINHCKYESHKTNQPHKSFKHTTQDVPWENPPNTEDEKPNNSLSIIDRLGENGLQHISKLPDKRYHLSIKEERSTKTLIMNLPSAQHFNNKS